MSRHKSFCNKLFNPKTEPLAEVGIIDSFLDTVSSSAPESNKEIEELGNVICAMLVTNLWNFTDQQIEALLNGGMTRRNVKRAFRVFSQRFIPRISNAQIDWLLQAIAPRVSLASLPLQTCSNAELERIIKDAQEELFLRYSDLD